MKIVDKEIDDHKNLSIEKRPSKNRLTKSKIKESSKYKNKGRISVPDESCEERIQPNYEDLRKMPFSLVDEDIDQINSPMQRYASLEDDCESVNYFRNKVIEVNQLTSEINASLGKIIIYLPNLKNINLLSIIFEYLNFLLLFGFDLRYSRRFTLDTPLITVIFNAKALVWLTENISYLTSMSTPSCPQYKFL